MMRAYYIEIVIAMINSKQTSLKEKREKTLAQPQELRKRQKLQFEPAETNENHKSIFMGSIFLLDLLCYSYGEIKNEFFKSLLIFMD
jgi:hypothetical protein